MSDEELQRLIGRLLAFKEHAEKRIGRLENALLTVLVAGATLWAKSQGFW